MTKKITMYTWNGSPEFWKNFVVENIFAFCNLPTRQLKVDALNNILIKYHAVYSEVYQLDFTDPDIRILEFESEAYYNWFVIQWGAI